MNRVGSVALAALITIVLSACGASNSSPGATLSSATPASSGLTQTSAPTAPVASPIGASASPTEATPAASPSGVVPQGQLVAYVENGDLWVVSVEGGSPKQLTSDGSSGAYSDPSFAPDGSIYAIRNKNQLVHLDLGGQPVAAPVTLSVLENGGEGLSVSPDGNELAYVTTGFGTYVDPRFGTPNGAFIYGGADVIGPDGKSVPEAAMPSMIYPSWSGSGQLVVTNGTAIFTDTVGAAPVSWIDLTNGCLLPSDCSAGQEAAANATRPVISQDGTVLVYQYQPYYGDAGRRIASVQGTAPGTPPVTKCVMPGQENFSDAGSLAGDGSVFAYDDSNFDPVTLDTTAGQGVWVMTVNLDAADCGVSSARLVAPGGLEPDLWSPPQ